jgi:TolB-like protein
MNQSFAVRNVARLMLAVTCVFVLTATAVSAQEKTVADKLAEALSFYNELEYDKGVAIAEELLTRTNLTPNDSIAIYEVLGIVTYAKGESFLQKAIGYLDRITTIGPCVVPLPRDIWPQELRDRWYKILKSQNKLICEQADPAVKTIAIMEFDNFSTGKYQEELGLLAKGLADFFAYDFAKISDFKVVERDKIDFILKEMEMVKSGAVDPATAVQVGKILGAKYMVFGSITQLDDKNTRMVVRVVSVETSEIVASVDKEGKPEYSAMEKELVKEMASKLSVKLGDKTLTLIDEGGTDSNDAASLYSRGLQFMDQYDYKKAYEYFKQAYNLDNTFVEAKRKMEIYQPLAG